MPLWQRERDPGIAARRAHVLHARGRDDHILPTVKLISGRCGAARKRQGRRPQFRPGVFIESADFTVKVNDAWDLLSMSVQVSSDAALSFNRSGKAGRMLLPASARAAVLSRLRAKIGRASCRERV